MKVTFVLLGRDGREFSEKESIVFSRSGDLPCAAGDFDGVLRLEGTDQEELIIRDDLHDLVPSACVEATAACLLNGIGHFALSTEYAQFGLTTVGNLVKVEELTQPPTFNIKPRFYPKSDFAAEMQDCAHRFERFLFELVKKKTDLQPALDRLQRGLQVLDQQMKE